MAAEEKGTPDMPEVNDELEAVFQAELEETDPACNEKEGNVEDGDILNDTANELDQDVDKELTEDALVGGDDEETEENAEVGLEEAEEEGADADGEALIKEEETPDISDKSDVKTDAKDVSHAGEDEKEQDEEEEDPEVSEEMEKKMAKTFDPNQMPQVNVTTLAQRRWQIKVYPLRPSDFMSGEIGRVFRQAKESLLYVYTAGNNGKFSNGKAELYMSSIGQAVKVMANLIKMDFYHPETNIKLIRKSDQGVVLEKAYMRFDTRMASLLWQPSGQVRRVGNKRERIIGSVFLKNLPDGATKDMLRVMFPFAKEINFNPEKFRESTARLVLSNRSAVIPCLKAFSKVELGGNVLELRPLEKRTNIEDELPKKSPKVEKPEAKATTSTSSGKAEVKTASKKEDTVKETPRKPPTSGSASNSQKEHHDNKPGSSNKKPDNRQRPRGGQRGGLSGSRGSITKKYNPSKFSSQRWQDRSSASLRGGRGAGRGRFTSNRGSYNRAGTSPARMSGMGMSESVSGGVTKEMMNLQAQLSVAIKNQISMLNQTKIAVEQAKRGAAASVAAAIGGAGGAIGALSHGIDSDQYSRLSDQSRRDVMDSSPRRRDISPRDRGRDRRDTIGSSVARSNRGQRGRAQRERGQTKSFAAKRSRFDSGSYDEEVSYNKRPSFGLGTTSTQRLGGALRSWADESEGLYNKATTSYNNALAFRAADYEDDLAYNRDNYAARSFESAGSRDYSSNRNLVYGSNYDYGY